jgi:hypothetical protein
VFCLLEIEAAAAMIETLTTTMKVKDLFVACTQTTTYAR